jgi:hypothetical protein
MKNEELNLVELLKDCPKGTKLYSPICGELKLAATISSVYDYQIKTTANSNYYYFTKEGYYETSGTPECLLFPSKDQRDWNVWKEKQDKKSKNPFKVGDYVIDNRDILYKIIEFIRKDLVLIKNLTKFTSSDASINNLTKVDKFDPKWLKPFDKVLCRHSDKDKWNAHFFSHIDTGDREYPFYATFAYRYCIPYNAETKHLIGTTEKAPEFYIN